MMGVLKLASNRSFPVWGSMHHKGEAVGKGKHIEPETEDVGSSPDPGLFCHRKLGLSFFTCNKKIYT